MYGGRRGRMTERRGGRGTGAVCERGDVPYVYLLRCADGSLYCGWTTDVERRLAAHRAGTASRYTRSRLPVELAAALPVADRSQALREEARIKRLAREDKLALITRRRAGAGAAASRAWPRASPPAVPSARRP
jgi:putative endonuclease